MTEHLNWATFLRKLHPTMLFYVSNTHNRTAVIYCRTSDGAVETMCTTLTTTPATPYPLPSHVKHYFALTGGGTNGTYTIPGLVDDRQWHVKGKSLVNGSTVLVNVLAEVDEATLEITCFYLTMIDTAGSTKSVVRHKVACDGTVSSCMHDLTSVTASLRHLVGL